jgi:hypothetical protein
MTALNLSQQQQLGLSPKKGRGRVTAPNQLSALEFWYDAVQSPVIETAGGIERLDDLSGNANHAGQTSAGARPIKTLDAAGRDVIRFDGSDDSLDVTTPPSFASGVTVFLVFRMRQRSDFAGIVSASATAGTDHVDFFTFQNASAASGNFQLFGRSTESDTLLWQSADDGGLCYAIFALDGGAGSFRSLGGTATDSYDGGFGTPDEIVLGARFDSGVFGHAGLDLLEVGLYSRKLSTKQMGSLEAYLLDRYQPAQGVQAEHSFAAGEPLGPDWTFSRSSGAEVRDHEYIWRSALSGELRHSGLRRVRNLFPNSDTPSTQAPSVVVGARYAFHFRDGGGTGSFALTGAATATVDEGQAFSFTATTTTLTCTLSGSPGASATVQLEETSGLASAAPSEYVDSDTIYNAKVAGVRYFSTANDNSFSAPGPGTVTEAAAGNFLSTAAGALLENQRTNYVVQSHDLTTSWTSASGATMAFNQVGIGGRANTASTASARLQGITSAGATAHVTSIWFLKDNDESRFPEVRIAGTLTSAGAGIVNVQINTKTGEVGARVGTPESLRVLDGGDWWIMQLGHLPTDVTGGQLDIYPARATTWLGSDASTQGSVTIGHVQVEAGTWGSSPIRTAGGTGTRNGDVLTLPAAGVAPAEIGLEISFQVPWTSLTTDLRLFGSDAVAGVTEEITTLGAAAWAWTAETGDKGGALEIDTADFTALASHTLGLSLTDSEQVAVLDGTTELDDTQSLSLAHSDTQMQVGFWDGSGGTQTPGLTLASFSYWTRDVVRSRIGG